MLRYLFFILSLSLSLYGSKDSELLKKANSLASLSTKSSQIRAYNDFKNLYLRSILNNNIKLKIDSLSGIIKSGKKLHIDVSRYSYEHSKLLKSYKVKKHYPNKKKSKKRDLYLSSTNRLQQAKIEDNELILIFKSTLLKSQVKHFTLFDDKKNRYKYIFDIAPSTLDKSYKLHHNEVDRIRLAQYKSNKLRLVIQHHKKFRLKFSRIENKLIISLPYSIKNEIPSALLKYTSPKRLDRSKIIVIDAGHGGKDPGAVGYKDYKEKNIVINIGKKLKNILQSRGYKVYMTRYGDKFIKLSERTKYANNKNADIFVSIHANAVPKKQAHKVHGVECYFLAKSRTNRAKDVAAKENSADMSDMNFYGKESFLNTLSSHNIVASNKLAIDLQRSMLASLKKKYKDVYDGGVREGPFWVLVGAQMPSVLVEVGFITHPKEAKRLMSSTYQKEMASGLANGIERYFLNN